MFLCPHMPYIIYSSYVGAQSTNRDGEGERNWRVVVSFQAFCGSVLPKTCDCVNPGVPYRLRLVSVERARGWTQGLGSGHLTGSQIRGARLAPHAWLAHDPEGRDPCLGHVQSYDPLTNWWERDSCVLLKQHQLHLQTSVPQFAVLTCSPVRSDDPNDMFNLKMTFDLPKYLLLCLNWRMKKKVIWLQIQLFTV